MELRPYQQTAVDAVYRHLRERDDNPVVVIPTAGGKTPVIATICKDAVTRWSGRVLVLAHVKELLEQAVDKLRRVCPEVGVGVYSAGLGRRDVGYSVTVAGIQSVYQRAEQLGEFDLVIIDEAHLIPPDGDGKYRQFLGIARVLNPHLRVIGLTATPFRMKSGPICTEEGPLHAVCFEVGIKELIRDGYLCPLRSKAGATKADTSNVHVRGGEFVADELEDAMDQDALVRAACGEIMQQTAGRKSCLIFAAGIRHGEHITRVLQEEHGQTCGFVSGDTPGSERDKLLGDFRAGRLKYLANVNVLTTGFDAPNIDCVALLRPTMSPGLYYQMVGRGFRLHEGKADCLVLDFGGNVLRHGPVDQIKIADPSAGNGGTGPAKECPQCNALIHAAYGKCPECGYEFPPPERQKHDATAATAGVLSGEVTITDHRVRNVFYSLHTKRDAAPDAPRTMRVDYEVGYYQYKSEWVCFEHSGYARQKAEAWWRKRCRLAVPDTTEDAVILAQTGHLAFTNSIKVRSVTGEQYDRIVDYELGERPEVSDAVDPAVAREAEPQYVPADDDIPF
jgi:DNA repair protein RadD